MTAKISRRRALAAGLLLALSACSRSVNPSAPAPTAAGVAASASVTLVLWHSWSGMDGQLLGTLVDQYNRANPAGRVVPRMLPVASFASELRDAVRTGSAPQLALLLGHWVPDLARARLLLPLDDRISAAEQASIIPSVLATARASTGADEPQLYGMPIGFDIPALFYNRASVEVAPGDTNALFDLARGLTDTDNDPPALYGLALNLALDTTIGYLYAFGGRIFNASGALILAGEGRAGTERWLEWLVSLQQDREILASLNALQVNSKLKGGQALMTIEWAHQFSSYRTLWGDERLGIVALPRLSETRRDPQPYVRGDILAITERLSSNEQRVALEFMRYLGSSEAQQALLNGARQPARSDLPINGDTLISTAGRAFRLQAERALPMPGGLENQIVRREFEQMLRSVLLGLATPAEAVSAAEQRIGQGLEQFNLLRP